MKFVPLIILTATLYGYFASADTLNFDDAKPEAAPRLDRDEDRQK